MARGLLVVAVAVSGTTCRIADLINVKSALLKVEPAAPDTLKASSAFGSTALRIMPIEVLNDGGGELEWRAFVKHGSPWVTLDPDTGTAGQTPTLQAVLNPAGLDSGFYQDTVVVQDRAGTGTLETPVLFRIHSCIDTIGIAVGDSVSTFLTTADCAAPHRAKSFAKLYRFSGIAGDSVTIEVPAAFDAYVALDTSLAANRPPLVAKDDCLGTPGDPCIYYALLPTTRTYWVEVTSADSADTGAFKLRVLRKRSPDLPGSLAQFTPDSTTPVDPGGVLGQSSIVVRAVVSDPDLADVLQLQAEIVPVATPFTNTPTQISGVVPNGSPAYVSQPVADNTTYHWQVRTVDETGASSSWVKFTDPAFNVQTGHDPTFASPNQYQSDATTVIPIGGNANQATVIFKAQLNDVDAGNQLTLQVEVEPVGTNFDSVATGASAQVAPGATATASISGLTIGGDYHWQMRAVDNTGRHSAWTSFGGNAESAADFHVAGTPTNLVWQTQPSQAGATVAGSAISGPPKLALQDQNGVTLTSFNGQVTMAISTRPAGGQVTLLGTTTVNAANGVASFPNLIIDTAGVGYKLTATATTPSGSISSVESNGFTITAAAVTQLVFTVQPLNAVAGAVISPAVKVSAEDQFGNVNTSFTGAVAVAIANNPGNPPGTLGGTLSMAAVSGVATFSNLTINKTGVGYTLRANSGTLPTATSAAFTITPGPATHLAFTVSPGGAAAGQIFAPPVQVAGLDANDNLVTSFGGNVTVAIGTNPPGNGVLSGTKTQTAATGTASFSDLSIDKVGNGYTLIATSGTLTQATSAAFNISNAPVDSGQSTVQASPTTITACQNPGCSVAASTATTITVTAKDIAGNPVPNVGATIVVTGTGNNPVPAGSVTTNAIGQATWTLNSTKAEVKTVSATINSVPITQTATVTVNPATIASLVFTPGPPASVTAGVAIAPTVLVTGKDLFNNTATGFNGPITMALTVNPTDTLSGPKVLNAVAGVASFPGIRVRKTGTGYTLRASITAPVALNVTSSAFSVTAAPAVRDTFSVQPTTTQVAPAIINSPTGVVVTITDSIGNTVTTANNNVTVNLNNPPVAATLGGNKTKAAVNGVATFTDLTIDKVATGFTLIATANITGNPSDISVPFNITPGPVSAAMSTISASPTTITASNGSSASTITVTAKDAGGNPIQGATVVLAANPTTGNTLTQPVGTTSASGIATGTLSSTKAETKTVSATINGVTITATVIVTVNPANAATMQFTTPPTTTTAGAIINAGTGVKVTAFDAFNNVATGLAASVTVAITNGTGAPGANLGGTKTVTPAAGVATFSDLTINKVGTNYTLTATATGPTSAISSQFNITAGTPTQIAFITQPTSTTGGATISPVQVEIEDVAGNRVTTATNNVTIAITPGTGNLSGHLSGTTTVAAVSGVATFSTLSIDSAGTNYTLSATSGPLTGDISSPFSISVGAAAKLGFLVQPSSTTGGATITPAVQVEVRDAGGNRVTTASNSITLGFGTNAGPGAVLSGTNPVSAVNGLATFSNLSIDSAGVGYTLVANTTGLTAATSSPFTITVGAANKLGFRIQPTSTTAGATITPAVQVEVQDAGGNRVTSASNSVTIAIGTNPNGGTLSGTSPVSAINGVATFSNLSIDKIGTGYTLVAATSGLTGATSAAFDITGGTATKLGFFVQPTNATGGATMAQVQVEVQDAGGNRVTTASNSITVAIGTNPNSGTLGGTKMVTASSGVASFSTLSIDSAGTGYTLTASATGLTGTTSSTFNITVGAATKLGFRVQPSTTTGGATITPAVQVEVRDAGGNRVTTASNSITVAIGTNPNSGTLSGTKTLSASSGVASFSNLSIDSAGTGYTLTATAAGGLTGAISSSFNITVGAASKLAFHVQPANATAGVAISPPVQVEVQDAGGNRVTGYTNNVTVAFGANAGGGTLSGTKTVAASAGLASFSTLSVDKAAAGYTLAATAVGVATGATSSAFTISPAAATHLVITLQPTNSQVAPNTISPITLEIRDAFENLVTNATDQVTLAITTGTGTAGAVLGGTNPKAAVGGIVTFNNLTIDLTGNGYTLDAIAAGLTGATTSPFNMTP